MKKVTLWAGVVVVAALVAGLTSHFMGKCAQNADSYGLTANKAGDHIASYQPSQYPDLTYAAENAVKGVVNIEVTQEVSGGTTGGFGGRDPFLDFFGIPYQAHPQQPREQIGGGSGVIISPDGYIVTNNHVVENAKEVKVTLEDRRTYIAQVVGTDPSTDIALIKVEVNDLPSLPFGDSDALRLGEWVLAIGSPYGLQSTITAGIISAKARSLGAIDNQFSIESFIQTDAAVNPGNSGGALVNTKGELVGINTVIKSPTGSFAGYSFAVPVTIVKKVVMDLKEFGVVQRALLGIMVQEIDEAFLAQKGREEGITQRAGVYVSQVSPEGAAHAAGIKQGDVITQIQGVRIDASAKLLEEIAKYRPSDKVTVTLQRGSQEKKIEVQLRNKAGNTDVVHKEAVAAYDLLGGQFQEINERTKKELKISAGVQVFSIRAEGALAKARIARGYVITAINGRQVASLADLNRITGPIETIEGIYPDGRAMSYSIVAH